MFILAMKDTRFLACTQKCGFTQSLPKEGKLTIAGECEQCGWKKLGIKEKDKDARELCINRQCVSRRLKKE
jgi:DNA topoisomerase-1